MTVTVIRSRDSVQSGIIAATLFYRRHAADCRTNPPIVSIAHKIAPYKSFHLIYRIVFRIATAQIKQLVFHTRPHTLATSVVMASPSSAVHALYNSKTRNREAVFFACILASTVGMKNRAAHIRITAARVLDCLNAQLRAHIIVHRKSQNRNIKAVENRRNIEFAVFCGNFGDVCRLTRRQHAHFSQGLSATKLRFKRSSDFRASRSAFVIPLGFLRFG